MTSRRFHQASDLELGSKTGRDVDWWAGVEEQGYNGLSKAMDAEKSESHQGGLSLLPVWLGQRAGAAEGERQEAEESRRWKWLRGRRLKRAGRWGSRRLWNLYSEP